MADGNCGMTSGIGIPLCGRVASSTTARLNRSQEAGARCGCNKWQPLFGVDAGEEQRKQEGRKEDTDRRPECQRPAQRVDEQPEIARVADDAIDAARDQPVSGLDRHQSAEPVAQHEDRPQTQGAARSEQRHTQPA